MSVISQLRSGGGCSGGVAIYSGAKALCLARNANRQARELWPNTRKEMSRFLPKLNLKKVRFHIHSRLPGNWFVSADKVEGMTFGYSIYFKGTDYQKTRQGLKILLHELLHVDQVRRYGGEIPFACEYGKGYLDAGTYRRNPLEVEAYEFVEEHGDELPETQSNPKK